MYLYSYQESTLAFESNEITKLTWANVSFSSGSPGGMTQPMLPGLKFMVENTLKLISKNALIDLRVRFDE